MIISFSKNAWEDMSYFIDKEPRLLKKTRAILKDITRTPYEGIGKPEPLKHDFEGFWSRRIDKKHRLVYQIVEVAEGEDICYVIQCRDHY